MKRKRWFASREMEREGRKTWRKDDEGKCQWDRDEVIYQAIRAIACSKLHRPSSPLNTFSSARLDLSCIFSFLSHENYVKKRSNDLLNEIESLYLCYYLKIIIEIKLNTFCNVRSWRPLTSYFMSNNSIIICNEFLINFLKGKVSNRSILIIRY